MQIIKAKNIGFCFGVRRAVETSLKERENSPQNIYTLGKLIHNDTVVDELKSKGIIPVNAISDIPKGSTVIIRSHGIPPSCMEELHANGMNVVDATCPFVKRIHEIVRNHYKQGFNIVIIGEKTHPEVIGINGMCENTASFIKTPNDAVSALKDGKTCVVVQTTFSKEVFDEIESVIKNLKSDVVVFNTICNTTSQRQKEAAELAKICTQMIVIGGKESSNTKKLLDLCSKYCDKIQPLEK
ncbi:MAG: 4-hydroxy-3-methylbut-2-enyl diphosphate reductase, partial [Clostridia bacterium]|nr:4-hydroxy-3-methylbut-2-enyl diphosphate reductase [Clostridia bacterium]